MSRRTNSPGSWMATAALTLVVWASPAAAQTGSAGTTGTTGGTATTGAGSEQNAPPAQTGANADLGRIRAAIEREPALDLTKDRLRFYTLVVGQPIDVEKILGDYSLLYGPTRGGAAMTHQEFLDMVTPKELYGSGGIRPYELAQWSFVNIVGQALLRKAFEDLKNAKTEQEIKEIRARIDRELEAIRRGGS